MSRRKMWGLGLLGICLTLISRLPAQESKTLEVHPKTGTLGGQTAYSNSYAIIIGIGNYAFLPKDKQLNFATKDAADLRNVLVRSYGFLPQNITILLNAQATRANIEAALSVLADDKVKPDDRVLVYFSGHGQTVKLQSGGEMGFLIPYDAKVDLAHPENRSGYLSTCLRMDSLWGFLEASAAKHRLLIADACFGGLLIRGKALDVEKPNRAVISNLLARPALQVMTAGASNEEAQEDPKLGHSAYTFKLLEELQAQAATADNVFLASELAAFLKTSVGNLTKSKQTPQFGNYGATEGDFVFVSTESQHVPPLQLTNNPQLLSPSNPSPNALFQQGKEAEATKDYATALSLYRKAAEAGNTGGMSELGKMFEFGLGVEKDYEAALKWYRKAIEAGDARGMSGLGAMYGNGHGIAKDELQAAYWTRKGAEAGDARGMYHLGVAYENGLGLVKDYVEAAKWYRKAANVGYAYGMTSLGLLYQFGHGVEKDEQEAVKWYRKAAEAGDEQSMTCLGWMYESGSGIERDEQEAVKWYRKAAEAGDTSGMTNLGTMYANGNGVAQDYVEAVRWFRKSISAGNTRGMVCLGMAYENGHGVAKDEEEAVKWYRKAAEAGDNRAKEALKRLGK